MPDRGASALVSRCEKLITAIALAAALAFAAVLGVRTITSNDLGYHLAYGEEFLKTGRIVDHNPYIYTLPPQHLPAGQRPEPGPGAWYDDRGRYRFANANWLSQVLLAGAYRAGGMNDLCVFRAVTVAGLFGLLVAIMRRLGLPWLLTAFGVLLVGLSSYMRLELRPELFGYVALAVQFLLLARAVRDGPTAGPLRWPVVLGLIATQVVFVNLHSYFLIGLGLTAAVFAEQLLWWLWQRVKGPTEEAGGQSLQRVGIALAGQVAACFVNPWTWRLAFLPVQTVLFIRRHGIADGPGAHPWSQITELRSMFHAAHFPRVVRDYALCFMIALVAVALVIALVRRRPALVVILIAISAVGLAVPRNAAMAAIVLVPLAFMCLWQLSPALTRKVGEPLRTQSAILVGVGVMLAGGYWSWQVVSNDLYFRENMSPRFGLGVSRSSLPVGVTQWLDEHFPGRRVWCDFSTSSYLRRLSDPPREVPVLTNTWAYPPAVLAETVAYSLAQKPIDALANKHGFALIVLKAGECTPVFRELAKSPEWGLVHMEGKHAVFLRARGKYTRFVMDNEVTAKRLREAGYLGKLAKLDAVPAYPLLAGARMFRYLGWHDLAVEAAQAAVEDRPKAASSWGGLGAAHYVRGVRRETRGDVRHRDDLAEAEKCFRRALALRPNYHPAKENLARLAARAPGESGQ